MIDSYLRHPFQQKAVEPTVRFLHQYNISPHLITLISLLSGISIIPALAFGKPVLSLSLLALSGYCDVLDGSLARKHNQSSSIGAVFDIVSDRIVEFSILLGLYLMDPIARALPVLLMLGSILICVTSFLVVGIFRENDSDKSFYYNPGLIERSEAFLFFAFMILFPSFFSLLSVLFILLVSLTALIRVFQFSRNYSQ